MPPQSYYIDTDILLFYFDKKGDKGRFARTTVHQIKSRIEQNPEIMVKISQIVLGELILSFCEKKCNPEKMIQLLLDLNADMPPANAQIMTCAMELLRDDLHLDPNDSIIVSQALTDPSTKWFFTTDRKLIGNRVITEKMETNGYRFSIAPSF